MHTYHFERDARTPYSEAYVMEIDGDPTGHVDLHFTDYGAVHATLCVPPDADEDDVLDIIGEVDERLVLPVAPLRSDFVATVWRGTPAGVYSEDDELDEDDEDDEDEDDTAPGNGRSPA